MLKAVAGLAGAVLTAVTSVSTQTSADWPAATSEALRHFQALVQLDTSNPPGHESRVADYLKRVLEGEGIPVTLAAQEPDRANVLARLKGNGSKRPLLIMGHSDVVMVDAAKWTVPPFSATRRDGYIYGRGTLDDKSNLTAALMTMVMLKRTGVALDRDVIFVSEVGEEASTGPGIEYLVANRWSELDAEFCIAEGGGVRRLAGRPAVAAIETTEKRPLGVELVARGPAGHGSRPTRANAVVHLARAVAALAAWQAPMRLNDTTRAYFQMLAAASDPQSAAAYKGLFDPSRVDASLEWLATNDPGNYSMVHTSISPTILQAGYQVNVIPSEARATIDIRTLPDEDVPAFFETLRRVIDDPTIEIVPTNKNLRPPAAPSRLDTPAYRAIEAAYRSNYGVPTLPYMLTGATDMAFLRARGMQCYGVGPMVDEEDAAKGFGPHGDQERILEEAFTRHVRFFFDAVRSIAAAP